MPGGRRRSGRRRRALERGAADQRLQERLHVGRRVGELRCVSDRVMSKACPLRGMRAAISFQNSHWRIERRTNSGTGRGRRVSAPSARRSCRRRDGWPAAWRAVSIPSGSRRGGRRRPACSIGSVAPAWPSAYVGGRASRRSDARELLPDEGARDHADERRIRGEVALPQTPRLLLDAVEPFEAHALPTLGSALHVAREDVERSADAVAHRHRKAPAPSGEESFLPWGGHRNEQDIRARGLDVGRDARFVSFLEVTVMRSGDGRRPDTRA